MTTPVVLLVEDNTDDVELTLRSFQKHSFSPKMVVARNGEEALDYLFARVAHAQHDPVELPVLILLDLKLPRVDGFDVLRQIRSHPRTRYIPVVVLSTSSQSTDMTASYAAGANSYIRKPVDFDRFMDVTRQMSAYWLTVNEPPPTDGH